MSSLADWEMLENCRQFSKLYLLKYGIDFHRKENISMTFWNTKL